MAETKGELVVLHDRRDRLEATRLVRKLETAGYRVALKDSPLGQRRKADAPTVLLWSRHAGARHFRSVLNDESAVIAKVDGSAPPTVDATITDLRGWRGQDRHHGWKTLLEAVGPAAPAAKAAAPASPTAKPLAAKSAALKSTPTPKAAASEDAPRAKGGNGILIGVLAAVTVAAIGWAVVIFVL